MEQDETREILRAIPLFGEVLDGDQIDALAHKANPVVIPAGAVLMEAGDFGISMFVIVSGFVSVSFTDRHGDVHDVADLGPGNVVGEMSLLTGARRSASVTALEEVSALEITKYSLEAILRTAPDLIDAFGAVLARRQAQLDKIAADADSHEDIVGQIKRFFPAIFGRS